MKKIIFLFLLATYFGFAQPQTVTYSVSPATFEETDLITITVNGNSINETTWGVVGNALYMWAWAFDLNDTTQKGTPLNGSWAASDEASRFTYDAGTDTYSKTITPTTYYNTTGIGKIGFLIKAKNGGSGLTEKKSQDITVEVGVFQVTLISPLQNSSTIIVSGGSLNIAATNSAGNASYNLKSNGVSINTNPSTSSYSFAHTNITANQNYELDITQGATTITKKFSVIVNPLTASETIPAGLVDGINYNTNDATKATLVLEAPGKDFVYVAGSFNNWQPGPIYAMKKDATADSTKFWLELTGLVSGTNYTYQYWVLDQTPAVGSPVLVKTADPYSTLVLKQDDNTYIPAGNYPNLPVYPDGQDRDVTVLQTGQIPYAWSAATTNFVKPEKDKLVVYEVLVRDFDVNSSFQNLIDRIDYFKSLKVNAIELMPVMEYEFGDWGYAVAFHMALDKKYGPGAKLKEFIDLCHQNGIAVILDVALNHAFGRNPMDRMWMNDPDGDGWGGPSSDNPYFNVVPRHSYNVGNDFNHQSSYTKNYTKRVVKQWIEEFKIDGFRWDLTKGFTQNCPPDVVGGQEACTGSYQQDRVNVLKDYADYSWGLDPTHYIIFEHLGNDSEEQQWANYKIDETPSKGVMMWAKGTEAYNELSMGYNNAKNNIERMGYDAHGFSGKRVIGYPESHDEERLMYKNVTYGNSSNPTHDVKNLNIALSRMSAIGAVSLLIPGPKMIWHFGALGWEKSIWTCSDGTVNIGSDDCKLSKKPQPQWVNNWLGDVNRNKIYFDWSKMIALKTTEPVFNVNITANSGFDIQSGNTLTPRLFLWDNTMPATQLKNVVVLTNFDVNTSNVVPDFPYIGTWYNLMDNSSIEVASKTAPIAIEAGGFRIYGNKPSTLGTDIFEVNGEIYLYPNPASNYFTLNATTSKVEIYSITGQLVKSFNANQSKENQYPISDLNQGIYLVKVVDENNELKVMKLLKQ